MYMPHEPLSSKASHILERADGSDDRDSDSNSDSSTGNNAGEDANMSEPEETAEMELSKLCTQHTTIFAHIIAERLLEDWVSPIYIFFKPTPAIEYIKERRVHVFQCDAKYCKGRGNGRHVRRYLDTGDAKSTSNLRKHAKICWGEEAVAAADSTRDIKGAERHYGS